MVGLAVVSWGSLDTSSDGVGTSSNSVSTPGRAGSPAAGLELAAREHEVALFQRAMRLTRNRHEAEDLVHDTFERLLRNVSQLRPDTNVLVWMYTVMHNLFLDHCRRRARGP